MVSEVYCRVSCFLDHGNRLPPESIGMLVDKGHDFPQDIEEKLLSYGADMWLFRNRIDCGTTRALVSYRGEIQA